MAEFNDRDTSGQVTIAQTVTVEEITFKRYRGYAGAPLTVSVTKVIDGVAVIHRVPQSQVDAAWPGTARTLKAHLLACIDAAV